MTPTGMLSRRSLHNALAICLLQAAFASARAGIKIPIIINASTVHTVAFSFLIIFSILTGLLFIAVLAKSLAAKEEFPPEIDPAKYATGRPYNFLALLAVGLWWAQIILYTIYVRNVYMRKPRRGFSDTAYVARYTLDQLTDFFVAAATLQLIYYRRRIHSATLPSFSPFKKVLDAGLLILHLAAIVYTTFFLASSVASDRPVESKYVKWLTSYNVYTAVYTVGVVNVAVTAALFRRSVKKKSLVDEPCSEQLGIIPGSICAHALFKIVIAIVYSQYKNNKIDYDALRVFDVIILGITYFLAMAGLVFAGSTSKEDLEKIKEWKEKEKQVALEPEVPHEHK